MPSPDCTMSILRRGTGMQRTELAVLAFTADGAGLAVRLKRVLGEKCRVYLHSAHAARGMQEDGDVSAEDGITGFTDTGTVLEEHWTEAEAILFISAAGIAVRSSAPFLRGKALDPAVLCMDDTAGYVIPLLSGHLGGANEWAERIAAVFGAEPVITTSTDRHGVFAVDLYAKAHGFVIEDPSMIRKVSGALLAGERVGWCCDEGLTAIDPGTDALVPCRPLPAGIEAQGPERGDCPQSDCSRPGAGITLTQDSSLPPQFAQECRLYPRNIYLGIGCRRGKSAEQIGQVVREALEANGISMKRVCAIASIDVKKDEKGICELAGQLGAEFVTFSAQQLMETEGEFSRSGYVLEQVGADNVCERSAVRASGGELIFEKYARDGVTVAAAGRKI